MITTNDDEECKYIFLLTSFLVSAPRNCYKLYSTQLSFVVCLIVQNFEGKYNSSAVGYTTELSNKLVLVYNVGWAGPDKGIKSNNPQGR